MQRWLTVAVVLGLVAFAWFAINGLNARQAAQRGAQKTQLAESSAAGGVAQLAAVKPAPDNPGTRGIGFGLTFALVANAQPASDSVALQCHGEPAPLDRPHADSCNPYQGDTSCRTVLPVLCFRPSGSGELMATEPVMGAVLQSQAVASARCEAEFGAGWRMAEFHDGGGWQLQGRRGAGFRPNTRYWVHINDQPGNCWDSPP